MNITDLELEALRKFNSGKNASALSNDLQPGTYPVSLTVTLEGELRKGKPGLTRSRNTSGAANIVRYLLDRINDATYNCLQRDIAQIRKGEFTVKNGGSQYETRLDETMPYREYPRAGTTAFNGTVLIEDITATPTLDEIPKGLRVVGGE
jgi:hypothetical protein